MRTKSRTCWRSSLRRGVSLIEVVAGIALAATLLASTLVAVSRHFDQVQRAALKQQGVDAADELLLEWRRSGVWDSLNETLPSSGEVDEKLVWRLDRSPNSGPQAVGGLIVEPLRLEVLFRESIGGPEKRLAGVEFVVSSPVEVPTQPEDGG